MKLRSAPLDEIRAELDYAQVGDGRRLSRLLMRFERRLYNFYRYGPLLLLRVPWRRT